jgi:hypothetical protein
MMAQMVMARIVIAGNMIQRSPHVKRLAAMTEPEQEGFSNS